MTNDGRRAPGFAMQTPFPDGRGAVLIDGPRNKRAGLFADTLSVMALCLTALFAALLVYESFFYTAAIDPQSYKSQHMIRYEENELTNLIAFLMLFVLLRALNRVRVSRSFVRALTAVLFTLAAAFAVAWTLSAKAIPDSDQGILIESAQRIVAGDTAVFGDPTSYLYLYFVRYPFQFGFLGYTGLLLRAFGYEWLLVAGPILNVGWLIFAYIAVAKTTDLLFADHNVTCLAVLLLAACTQLLFACTFYYGTLPCMALSMWMAYFTTSFLVRGRRRDIPLACLAAACAVTMKSNAWIYIAAAGIVLALRAIRSGRLLPVFMAALLAVSAIPGPIGMQKHYESRHGVVYGDGYPLSAWMSMSMQESSMACGWYSTYMVDLVEKHGMDADAAGAEARAHIGAHLQKFAADPAYAHRFFEEKFWSQWTEPSYMSIWASKSCLHYGEIGALAETVYRDEVDEAVIFVQNQYIQVLFAGFLLYALTLLRRRRDEWMLYPITMLGALLFHLLFEANAKYVLAYLPMFAPMAAYGLLSAGNGVGGWVVRRVREKRAPQPEEFAPTATPKHDTEP